MESENQVRCDISKHAMASGKAPLIQWYRAPLETLGQPYDMGTGSDITGGIVFAAKDLLIWSHFLVVAMTSNDM